MLQAAQLFAQEQTSSIIAKFTITIAAAVAAAVVPVEGSSNPGSPISSYLQFLRDGTSASNDLCPMSHDAKSLRTSGTVLPLTFRFSISIEAMVGVVPVPGLKASMVVFHPPNAGEMPPLPAVHSTTTTTQILVTRTLLKEDHTTKRPR
ncbi:hypothetical protein GQ600_26123 [Phytophthora cactorum]|nr:hypothetical protein GQ600_26123 [Phytophthora cactorum]